MAAERLHREDCERQAALQRATLDAGIVKVQTNPFLNDCGSANIEIFDINIKVQQKLAGYLAHQVRSVRDAKKLFDVEVEGIAGFACTAGMINTNTEAFEIDELKAEL